uniref:Uncharacterized protein n=2 Tax=Eutreptiella gymnastica TaxID=73025 RepID=A0A7S4G5T5_9EUGL
MLSASTAQEVQGAAQDSDLAEDQMAYLQVFRIDVAEGESLREHTHTVDHYHALVGDYVLHGYDVDMVVSRLGAEGRASHALTFSAMSYVLQGKKAVEKIAFTSDVMCLAESARFLYIYHCPATDPNHGVTGIVDLGLVAPDILGLQLHEDRLWVLISDKLLVYNIIRPSAQHAAS